MIWFLISINFGCSYFVNPKSNPSGLNEIKIPNYELIKLANGIQVYFMEDASLPIFTVQGMLSKGSSHDFKDKSGVSALMVSMLKEGSGHLNSEQYKAAYSKYSSDFEVNIDKDAIHFKSAGLSKYNAEIIELFLETVFNPNFIQPDKLATSKQDFNRVKEKRIAQIITSQEEAGYLASIAFYAKLFENSSYGTPEWGTVNGVEKTLLSDVQSFYSQHVQPSDLQFALSGNFSKQIKAKFLSRLKSISPRSLKPNELEPVLATGLTSTPKPRLIIVDKPNLKQAEVRMGHMGLLRNDKDFISLYIANSIVGSGDFSSQLMQEIRVKRGLVYGINSAFTGYKNAGAFVVSSSTRFEKVPELINTTLDIIKATIAKGIESKDLDLQKSILLGQFPLKFETDESFLQQLMKYNSFGFDKNYIQGFFQKIQSLDVNEANLVLQKHYKPEDFVILVLAPKNQLPKNIKDLNVNLETIDHQKLF